MKTVLAVSAGLVIIIFTWITIRHKLWERISIFATQPVFGKTWNNEVEKQKNLYDSTQAELIFLGDSHMEQCEWQEIFSEFKIANRGIGGETTEGLFSRIPVLPEGDPSRIVFLQIGINDLLSGRKPQEVLDSYIRILNEIARKRYSVVPTLVFYVRYIPDVNPEVTVLNQLIEAELVKRNIEFINLNPEIAENETLLLPFSSDGVHLTAAGYQKWVSKIRPFIAKYGPASDSLSKMNR